MEDQENTEQEERIHQIWIGKRDLVASFHAVDGYEQRTIQGQNAYVELLQELQEQGYRFQ